MGYHRLSCLLGAVLSLALPVTGQRSIAQITALPESHQDAKISPDGLLVAFKGPSKIGVVAFVGGTEGVLATGASLGDFLWSPTSSGIYFLDSGVLKFVGRAGGAVTTLASLPGQRHRLWCVDAVDQTLWATRWDPVTFNFHIFTVRTSGASPTDIVTSVLELDDVKLDPTQTSIVYRAFVGGTPFPAIEFFSNSAAGGSEVSLSGAPLNSNPQLADWADNGQSIVFSLISPSYSAQQIGRIGPAGTQISMMTDGGAFRRNCAVTRDRQWIVCEAQGANGICPAIVPTDGGGLVPLGDGNTFYLFKGPPTADASGTKIAFAATVFGGGSLPQVFTARLDRDLRIHPRLEVGNSFQVDMPIAAAEIGAVLLGAGLLPAPFPLPGFAYGLSLDPTILVVVASGSSASGNLSVSITVPNTGALVGQSLFFQGLRVAGLAGEFTRAAETLIF